MKPRTRFEKRIVELLPYLPPAPKRMGKWLYRTQIEGSHVIPGFTGRGNLCHCGHCGRSFAVEGDLYEKIKEMKAAKRRICTCCPHYQGPGPHCPNTEIYRDGYYEWKEYESTVNPKQQVKAQRRSCNRYKEENSKYGERYVRGRCPHCGKSLKIYVDRKVNELYRFGIALMVLKGIQLYRIFAFSFRFEKGKQSTATPHDCETRWINEEGCIRTTRKQFNNNHKSTRDEGGNLVIELRWNSKDYAHDNLTANSLRDPRSRNSVLWDTLQFVRSLKIFPELGLADYLKRRLPVGFTGVDLQKCGLTDTGSYTGDLDPEIFLCSLIRYPFLETLVKERNNEVLTVLYEREREYTQTIATAYFIARRHKYVPGDMRLWADMVELYYNAKKDIRNPRFICPQDLAVGHQEAQDMYNAYRRREKKKWWDEYNSTRPHDIRWYLDTHEKEWKKLRENPALFDSLIELYGMPADLERVSMEVYEYVDEETGEISHIVMPQYIAADRYCAASSETPDVPRELAHPVLNLEFGDEELRIKSLDSWEEYDEEGRAMHNCVETNGYWRQTHSAVLSVRKDGKRVADVQLNLRTFDIVQCWGPCNQETEYTDRIRKLIKDNIPLIQSRLPV